jgi:hypothetical protein
MDHRYLVAITRTGTYQGELTIADGLVTVYCRPVELMYNALTDQASRTLRAGKKSRANSSTAVWPIDA